MRSRYGLINEWDPIVREVKGSRESTRSSHGRPPSSRERDAPSSSPACATPRPASERGADHVESFKTDTSVLRNSVLYFPGAATNLADHVATEPGGEPVVLRSKLLSQVLLYEMAADRKVCRGHVQAAEGRSSSGLVFEGPDRAAVENLLKHVQIIVTKTALVDASTEAIPGRTCARSRDRGRVLASSPSSRDRRRHGSAGRPLRPGARDHRPRCHRVGRPPAPSGGRDERGQRRAPGGQRRAPPTKGLARRSSSELKSRFVSADVARVPHTPLGDSLVGGAARSLLGALEPGQAWRSSAAHPARHRHHGQAAREGILIIGKSGPTRARVRAQASRPRRVLLLRLGPGHAAELSCRAHHLRHAGRANGAKVDEPLLGEFSPASSPTPSKYSRQDGRVDVEIDATPAEARFLVRDQGIGIPEEDRARLFESFHRGSNVGDVPGTGLGLAVVKRSVDRHGGRIEVSSEVGVGTTFIVTIPLAGTASA